MNEVRRILTISLLYVALLALAVAVLGGCRSNTIWQETTNNEKTARASRARDTVLKQLHDTINVRETTRHDTATFTTYKTLQIIRHANAHEAARHDTTIIIEKRDTSTTKYAKQNKKSKTHSKDCFILTAAAVAILVFIVIIGFTNVVKHKMQS